MTLRPVINKNQEARENMEANKASEGGLFCAEDQGHVVPFDSTTIQPELNKLYADALQEVKTLGQFSGRELQQLSAPFFLKVSPRYFEAPLRVLFVGQETRKWWGKLGKALQTEDAVERLLAHYESRLSCKLGRSPFHQMRRRTEKELAGGMRDAVVWCNLLKMDVDRGAGRSRNARAYSQALEEFSAKLVCREVELLRPHAIIFACGPRYDYLIKKYFSYSTIEVIEPRALWHFKINGAHCYRTWHPRSQNNRGEQKVGHYYRTIFSALKMKFWPATDNSVGVAAF